MYSFGVRAVLMRRDLVICPRFRSQVHSRSFCGFVVVGLLARHIVMEFVSMQSSRIESMTMCLMFAALAE